MDDSAKSRAGRPRGTVLALALSTALGLALVLCGGAAPAVAAPAGGVNISGFYPGAGLRTADREIAAAHALHATLVRAQLTWSDLEPQRRGQVDPEALAFTDRLVADAAANGIGVILVLDSSPCWASSAPADVLSRCSPSRASAANSWPPRNPADYAAVAAYLAGRYGTHLSALEVWNEPDQANELYFGGRDKARRYAAVLRAAYPAIKRANPSVAVLGGSLVGSSGVFLRALYAAGIQGYYDGLAVHYYTLTLASVRAIHAVQVANGDTKPLWLDEFGWSSCYPQHRIQEEQACVTDRIQAANITNVFRSLARVRYIAADVVYQLQNTQGESFGVQKPNGAHKPAFSALARVLASPIGSPERVRLRLRRTGSAVQAVGSAPVGDYLELQASVHGILRYKAVFTLDRFNRYAIRLPSILGTRGIAVRVSQRWAGAATARI
jgi:polysaccharide biosynthesis protein PslG